MLREDRRLGVMREPAEKHSSNASESSPLSKRSKYDSLAIPSLPHLSGNMRSNNEESPNANTVQREALAPVSELLKQFPDTVAELKAGIVDGVSGAVQDIPEPSLRPDGSLEPDSKS